MGFISVVMKKYSMSDMIYENKYIETFENVRLIIQMTVIRFLAKYKSIKERKNVRLGCATGSIQC